MQDSYYPDISFKFTIENYMRNVWNTEKAFFNFISTLSDIRIVANCHKMDLQTNQVFDCPSSPKAIFTIFEYILNVIIRFLRKNIANFHPFFFEAMISSIVRELSGPSQPFSISLLRSLITLSL